MTAPFLLQEPIEKQSAASWEASRRALGGKMLFRPQWPSALQAAAQGAPLAGFLPREGGIPWIPSVPVGADYGLTAPFESPTHYVRHPFAGFLGHVRKGQL